MLDQNQIITIALNQRNRKKSSDGKVVIDISIPTCHVTIISPSFGSPGIFEPGKDITLYVLADEQFYKLSQSDPESLSEKVINFHLKITPWKSTKALEDKFIYPKGIATSKITCTYLNDLREKKERSGEAVTTIPAEIRIKNKENKLQACIRESTRDYYIKAGSDQDGFPRPARPYLFQIDLKQDGMNEKIKTDVFYDCAWFIAYNTKSACEYGELQDLDCRKIAIDKSRALKPEFLYQVEKGKVNFCQFDNASPIQAYHPFVVSTHDHLNFGQLSDVHISSRQQTFRESQVRVLEGMDDSTSPTIGKLVNTTLDSFCDMLKQMAEDDAIDAIMITGDLIDYTHNFNPAIAVKGKGELWDMLHHDNHKDEKLYPRYIDDLAVLSLLKSYYDKPGWKKPIFLISGNHENYQDVYGISPRVFDSMPGVSSKGLKRANQGVPADHNLTIYEACLMYGPDFGWYSKASNFKKSYSDWFYHLFTPLTDYRFTFKKQSVVALGWGDDEDIFNVGLFSADLTLYRASESVSKIQLELIEAAIKEGEQRLLCTHYPLASYDVSMCLSNEGDINCNDLLNTVDLYSQGTFKKNRATVYQHLHDKKFHYTLSGHSHRSGIYSGSMKNSWGRKNYMVTGREIPLSDTPAASSECCQMVVSGCSGPVGVQNHYATTNEGLGSFGLDYPSGNKLTLTPGAEQIKRIIPTILNAKPRFAVALDYMDIIGREEDKVGVFEDIISDAAGAKFTFKINSKLPKDKFIEDIKIMAYIDGTFKSFPMRIMDKGNNLLEAELVSNKRIISEKLAPQKGKDTKINSFLSITFNKSLADKLGYTQYNYDTPWIFSIEFVDRKAELEQELRGAQRVEHFEIDRSLALVNGYAMRRHRKFGEIPNFKWYKQNFNYNYTRPIA